MNFSWDSDKELLRTVEKLLLDTQTLIVSTEDVGTSTEVKREDFRIAAKNIAESEKMLICLMMECGPLGSNLGWRFISTQRMHANLKREVRGWCGKLFRTDHLQLSSFNYVYEHIEEQCA